MIQEDNRDHLIQAKKDIVRSINEDELRHLQSVNIVFNVKGKQKKEDDNSGGGEVVD